MAKPKYSYTSHGVFTRYEPTMPAKIKTPDDEMLARQLNYRSPDGRGRVLFCRNEKGRCWYSIAHKVGHRPGVYWVQVWPDTKTVASVSDELGPEGMFPADCLVIETDQPGIQIGWLWTGKTFAPAASPDAD